MLKIDKIHIIVPISERFRFQENNFVILKYNCLTFEAMKMTLQFLIFSNLMAIILNLSGIGTSTLYICQIH